MVNEWMHGIQDRLWLYFSHFTQLVITTIFTSLLIFNVSVSEAAGLKLQIDKTAHKSDELLVKFKKNVIRQQAANIATMHGAISVKQLGVGRRGIDSGLSQWRLIKLPPANIRELRARLEKDPGIERVELNHRISIRAIPDDPLFVNQWNLHNIGQPDGLVDADIDAPEAWDIVTGSRNGIVAVIDTGIDLAHPDLIENIWINEAEVPGNGIDDDGNGYIDDTHGYDFLNRSGNLSDGNGHGTHVSGIVAAQGNNGVGVSGVSWNAQIMPLKFLGVDGSGFVSDAIEAIQYAVNMNARVINASWGSGVYSRALADAIQMTEQAGILFVAAAGNNASNTDVTPDYPASYAFANVISVAATTRYDAIADFSSYGVNSVDLGAPGLDIFSTIPQAGGACCLGQSGYAYLSGTSMAAPHVSGAAALLLAKNPDLTNLEIKDRLLLSADTISSLAGITSSGGRLNVYNALEDDKLAPSPVSDFDVTEVNSRSVVLQWTTVGDDGDSGSAAAYDLRYSTQPIDATNFDSATPIGLISATGSAGSSMTYLLKKLDPETQYYIALKARDNVGNKSELSNIVTVKTKPTAVIYLEDMERGIDSWTISGSDGAGGPALWHVSSQRQQSGTQSLYYGRESDLTYNTGAHNYGDITSPSIDLTDAKESWLKFSHYLAIEGDVDSASVQVTSDSGVTWHDVYASTTSTQGDSFVVQNIDLSDYDGLTVQLRFSFDTRDALLNGFEGWYVDDVTISATAKNNPPIANPGGPYEVKRKQTLTLIGTGSVDPDSDVLTYQWDFGDGTKGTGATVQHKYQNIGVFTVTLVVSDGELSSVPVTTTVTVVNAPPLAGAGPNRIVKPKSWVALNGKGSSDPDGDSLSYQWKQVSGKVVRIHKKNAALAWFRSPRTRCGQERKLVFELTVFDSDGASSSDQVTIIVVRKCSE